MKNSAKILVLVGMTGSGKSSAVDFLCEKNFPKVYFGGVILDEVRARNLAINPENEKFVREDLRKKFGQDFVAQKIVEQIEDLMKNGENRIIADGLYSWTEYKILRKKFGENVVFVAIVAPRNLRYARLEKRKIRAISPVDAEKRDFAEIENLEKGAPIAMADFYVLNDGNLANLRAKIDEILREIKF